MSAATKHLVVSDGTTIEYLLFEGAEPAIVILHGLAGSAREFVPTAEALTVRRVILIDQRGHGGSTRVPADTSRDSFVSDVVHVISAETCLPVVLVGQSMGAHTAMLATASRPDLVERLVMLEGNQGGGTAEEHSGIGDFFRSWRVPFADRAHALAALGDSPLARAWIDDLEGCADGLYPRFDADVMQSTIEKVSEPRWSEWQRIEVPVLVIYADGGMFTDDEKAEFVRRGQNVRRVDLENATHDAHLDAFDQWIAALIDFISAR